MKKLDLPKKKRKKKEEKNPNQMDLMYVTTFFAVPKTFAHGA
jgi:hypothetical protein